jgi:ParB/RepB/Spo0J family partition protein
MFGTSRHTVVQLPVDRIVPPPRLWRKKADATEMAALADSIKRLGLLAPILVRPRDGRYEIVAGYRRWLCAKRLGWTRIAAAVRSLSDAQAAEAALADNVHRLDLSAAEKAEAFRDLAAEGAGKPEEIARRLGEGPEFVRLHAEILVFPLILREALMMRLLTLDEARVLAPLRDDRLIAQAIKQTRLEEAGTRGLREVVARLQGGEAPPAPPAAAPATLPPAEARVPEPAPPPPPPAELPPAAPEPETAVEPAPEAAMPPEPESAPEPSPPPPPPPAVAEPPPQVAVEPVPEPVAELYLGGASGLSSEPPVPPAGVSTDAPSATPDFTPEPEPAPSAPEPPPVPAAPEPSPEPVAELYLGMMGGSPLEPPLSAAPAPAPAPEPAPAEPAPAPEPPPAITAAEMEALHAAMEASHAPAPAAPASADAAADGAEEDADDAARPRADELVAPKDLIKAVRVLFRGFGKDKSLDLDLMKTLMARLVKDLTQQDPVDFLDLSYRESPRRYLPRHALNVAKLVLFVGKHYGYTQDDLIVLGTCGLLCDVGMLRIEEGILSKADRLDAREMQRVRSHALEGSVLLGRPKALWDTVARVAAEHHERVNGSGYPRGLKGAELHTYSKLAAIADTYEALTAPRLHKPPILPYEAMERIQHETETGLYDKPLSAAFVKSLGAFPIGSFVQLAPGEVAQVIWANALDPRKPIVRVVVDRQGRAQTEPPVVDLVKDAAAHPIKAVWPPKIG